MIRSVPALDHTPFNPPRLGKVEEDLVEEKAITERGASEGRGSVREAPGQRTPGRLPPAQPGIEVAPQDGGGTGRKGGNERLGLPKTRPLAEEAAANPADPILEVSRCEADGSGAKWDGRHDRDTPLAGARQFHLPHIGQRSGRQDGIPPDGRDGCVVCEQVELLRLRPHAGRRLLEEQGKGCGRHTEEIAVAEAAYEPGEIAGGPVEIPRDYHQGGGTDGDGRRFGSAMAGAGWRAGQQDREREYNGAAARRAQAAAASRAPARSTTAERSSAAAV